MEQILSEEIEKRNPKIIYLSGKTCSGKTTLSNELKEYGYKKIELDDVVNNSVVKPFGIEPQGNAFLAAYRGDGPEEQTRSFIDATKKEIKECLSNSHKIVIEGAVAKDWILKDIFSDNLNDLFFVYLLPKNLSEYAKRIHARFVAGVATNTSGLPLNFWENVDDEDVSNFIDTGKINDSLKNAFLKFATCSAKESENRMEHLKESFPDMFVIEF